MGLLIRTVLWDRFRLISGQSAGQTPFKPYNNKKDTTPTTEQNRRKKAINFNPLTEGEYMYILRSAGPILALHEYEACFYDFIHRIDGSSVIGIEPTKTAVIFLIVGGM